MRAAPKGPKAAEEEDAGSVVHHRKRDTVTAEVSALAAGKNAQLPLVTCAQDGQSRCDRALSYIRAEPLISYYRMLRGRCHHHIIAMAKETAAATGLDVADVKILTGRLVSLDAALSKMESRQARDRRR